MTKLYGAYNIAKFLGWQADYVKLGYILNFLKCPRKDRGGTIQYTYYLTEEQALHLKKKLIELGKELRSGK